MDVWMHPEAVKVTKASHHPKTETCPEFWGQDIYIHEEGRGLNKIVMMHSNQKTIIPPFDSKELEIPSLETP